MINYRDTGLHLWAVSWQVITGLLLSGSCPAVYAQENLIMKGALVEQPCLIAPGDENIYLDFGTIMEKYLATNQRTHAQPFQINLRDCDPELARSVNITLNGRESLSLPGLLEIDSASQASGVAIGIETAEGIPLKINEKSGWQGLRSGENSIPLKAYVQVEPEALKENSIKYGQFSAVATFSLGYQ